MVEEQWNCHEGSRSSSDDTAVDEEEEKGKAEGEADEKDILLETSGS